MMTARLPEPRTLLSCPCAPPPRAPSRWSGPSARPPHGTQGGSHEPRAATET